VGERGVLVTKLPPLPLPPAVVEMVAAVAEVGRAAVTRLQQRVARAVEAWARPWGQWQAPLRMA